MRHDAWRRDPASYPLRGTIQPRFTDVDVWQHLNNAALISMHGESVQQALRDALGPDAWRAGETVQACAASATDFLAEAYYPAPLTWGARATADGSGGLRVSTALFQHERCVGLHEASVVAWRAGHPADPGVALPPPPDAAHFPWHTRVGVRFGDADARRMASDLFLARCAEQMRVEFMNTVYGARRSELGGMMVAHVSLRWLNRTEAGAHWDLGCAVAHLGERSVSMRGAMFDAGRCVAVCDSTMVVIDPVSRRSAPLSPAARAVLEPWRAAAA